MQPQPSSSLRCVEALDKGKRIVVHNSQGESDVSITPISWADAVDAECLALTVRSKSFDEEKLLLVCAILWISSPRRTLHLKEILTQFWEAEQREMEEQRLKRHRKIDRELRNL